MRSVRGSEPDQLRVQHFILRRNLRPTEFQRTRAGRFGHGPSDIRVLDEIQQRIRVAIRIVPFDQDGFRSGKIGFDPGQQS